ncbi:MAG: Fe(3+) ABC transporter substrate-binding protein [Symploca sp. SIO2G7]|nr:Fe(3+) ABC transporter substrate-binding protein [Symploca sp. SIO2G7]
MKTTRRLFIAGGAAVAATALVPLSKPKRAVAQAGVLNLYTSRHYNTDEELYESFTRQTGIKVNRIESKAGELIERIKSEGSNSPADVFMTVDAGNLWRATQDGLFQPVNSEILKSRVPMSLHHPQGHWFGFSKRARVIIYNKEMVNPTQLSSYEDLADSKWRGKILIRSSSNIYNQSLIASLVATHGAQKIEEWLRGFTANFARPPEGNDTAQIKACAAGLGEIAIANSYYVARLASSTKPEDQEVASKIGMFFPNQKGKPPINRGTHVNISGGGVLATAPNPEAGVKFLEHLVSTASQRYFADGNNEYPVVSDVSANEVLKSFGSFKSDSINVEAYGAFQPLAVQLMDRVGWA